MTDADTTSMHLPDVPQTRTMGHNPERVFMVNLYLTPKKPDSRICLTDPLTVHAWCLKMKCTEIQLRAAVYTVGSDPYWIRKYFSQ
jgi:hypothetical protein